MTYQYYCKSCGFKFETTQSITDDSFKICPKCKGKSLAKIITGGSGFKVVGCCGSPGRCDIIKKEKLPFVDPKDLNL